MSTTGDGQQQVSRPLLIVLAVVVGLAAIYALWVFVLSPLLGGDDDGADTAQAPTPTPGVTDEAPGDDGTPAPEDGASPPPTAGPDDLLGQPVPETFEIFPARDPFQQLVVEVPAGEAGTSGQVVDADVPDDAATEESEEPEDPDEEESEAPQAPTIDGGDAADEPAPADDDDESSIDNGNGPETQGGTQTLGADGAGEIYEPVDSPVGNTTISMTSVTVGADGTESVAVAINDEPHEADEGEVFADRFQVLDIDGRCATYLFGDSRFTLCEGETITK